ncbi:MAG: ribonuclease E inhibitor RraB [Ferruginibacter sp.]|nr:ribonuclease E inhibitor RraB [Ferruginibacter sp.]
MTQTLNRLRKLQITDDEELKLEYFFYTNTQNKAAQLAAEMEKLHYTVKHGVSAGDKNLFIVTGWTTRMKMSDEIVRKWTNKMCETGYIFDCEFDGWETNPDQDDSE